MSTVAQSCASMEGGQVRTKPMNGRTALCSHAHSVRLRDLKHLNVEQMMQSSCQDLINHIA